MKTIAILFSAFVFIGCTAPASRTFSDSAASQLVKGETVVSRDGETFRYSVTGKPVFAVHFGADGKVTECGYVSE
jgi:hypothetical protein